MVTLTREFTWLLKSNNVPVAQLDNPNAKSLENIQINSFAPTYKLRITSYQRLHPLQPAEPHDPNSSFPPPDTPVATPSTALSILLSFPRATAFDLLLPSACQPALPPLPLYKRPFSSPSHSLLVSLSSFPQSRRQEWQRRCFCGWYLQIKSRDFPLFWSCSVFMFNFTTGQLWDVAPQ